MVQIGGGEGDEETPKFASLKTGQSITTITLEEALELFKLPRTVGEFEGTTVTIGAGRFGPYVLHAKKYTSIPKGEDPMSVTLERAIALIEEKRAKMRAITFVLLKKNLNWKCSTDVMVLTSNIKAITTAFPKIAMLRRLHSRSKSV